MLQIIAADGLQQAGAGMEPWLLRMKPMVIVGAIDEGARQHWRPSRPPTAGGLRRSGRLRHVQRHGEYLTALEQDLEITMRWLGTPGAFSGSLARVRRAKPPPSPGTWSS